MFRQGEEEPGLNDEEFDHDSEDDELPEVYLNHSGKMPPGSGLTDWAPMRQALIDHRISKGRNPNGSKIPPKPIQEGDNGVTITQPSARIDVAGLNQTANSIAKRILACKSCPHAPERHADGACNVRGCECAGYSNSGWQISAQRSETHNDAVFYKADAKAESEGDEGHSIGDVLYSAEDRVHYGFGAILFNGETPFAAFEITYEARPKKGKMVTAFSHARWKDEISGAGFSMQVGPFSDWFDIFLPPAAPRTPRKTLEEKRDAKLAAPIASGEWSE